MESSPESAVTINSLEEAPPMAPLSASTPTICSPHELNIPQWDSFKEELIMVRIEKNELLKTQEERDILQLELGERQNIIKELEKKVEAKVTRKPKKKKGDESARGADGV